MKESFIKFLNELVVSFENVKMEIRYADWKTDFLRFFQSQTNYNISRKSNSVNVSLYKDKRGFSFSMGNPTPENLKMKIEESLKFIDDLPQDPDFHDFETDLTTAEEKKIPNNIEEVSLEKKIDFLTRVSNAVKPFDFRIYGTFICNDVTSWIINSNGLCKKSLSSPIMLELKAVSDINEVTVLQSFGGEDFSKLDQDQFINGMVEKVQTAQKDVVDVDPGEYEVILAPRCIGEYFDYLTWGMSAGSLDQKQSFFEGKVGRKLFPDTITLTDDPQNPALIQEEYNGDGHVYNKTVLIENGVFKNFIVDNYYGRKTGLEKNGAGGSCLVMNTGDNNLEGMISGVKKGLYISSLHYMNFINMRETSLTGLTRDGTFLIEDGKMTRVVNNLRFTEKISDILNGIVEIEDKSYTTPFSSNYGDFGINTCCMPHVKVKGFKISSSTKTI